MLSLFCSNVFIKMEVLYTLTYFFFEKDIENTIGKIQNRLPTSFMFQIIILKLISIQTGSTELNWNSSFQNRTKIMPVCDLNFITKTCFETKLEGTKLKGKHFSIVSKRVCKITWNFVYLNLGVWNIWRIRKNINFFFEH